MKYNMVSEWHMTLNTPLFVGLIVDSFGGTFIDLKMEKGTVCVTGGAGYLASWMIKTLLEEGYSVNATCRSDPGSMEGGSGIMALPWASKRLKIFYADLSKPESFEAPIKGCIGVFHVAHPIDVEGKEPEHVLTKRAVEGSLGILQACINSKTVKKLIYTSTGGALVFNGRPFNEILDEESWSDIDVIRTNDKQFGASYFISKTLTEKATLEFGEKNGFDVVSVIPTNIHGPFVGPNCPRAVRGSMALIFGDNVDKPRLLVKTPFVHIDDVARAHIHLLEHPHAKGRYICSKIAVTIDEIFKLLSERYPEYKMSNIESLKVAAKITMPDFSSRKLLGTGFQFKYGLEEMFDDAIDCCKRLNIL